MARYQVQMGWVEVLDDRIVWQSSKRNRQEIMLEAVKSVGLGKAWTPWGKDTVSITTNESPFGLRTWKLKNGQALMDEINGCLGR
jgi:hypothetical protein